jgi:hypothetical protein
MATCALVCDVAPGKNPLQSQDNALGAVLKALGEGKVSDSAKPKPDGRVRNGDVSGCKSKALLRGRGVFRPVLFSCIFEGTPREPPIP